MSSYLLLGLLQGLTEFLPVSSSAHLVLVQKLLGLGEQVIPLTVVLHLGTCLSLLVFFSRDLLKTLRDVRMVFLILIVTVITGGIGLSGKHFFESLFESSRVCAGALVVTGTILLLTRGCRNQMKSSVGFKDALVLGFAQAAAIVPGLSRSGLTISTLLFRGITREESFRFSFLAALPAIFGAALLEAKDIGEAFKTHAVAYSIGFLVSFAAGLFALWLVGRAVRKAKLHYFGYYCIAAGVAAWWLVK